MSGYTGTQYELYYTLPSAVTTTTFTTATAKLTSALTATSVPRCIIPANYFSAIGKSFTFYAAGTIDNLATTATYIFSAGLDIAPGTIAGTGGATLYTSPAATPAASTNCPFEINGSVVCQAVGGGPAAGAGATTLQYNGNIAVALGASGASFSASNVSTKFSNNLTGVNNELNLWLELFGTFTGTTTGCTTTLQQLKLYLEN